MEIPGYYFDREKNRYFRITSTGPHSRDAIKKAEQAAERQLVNARAERTRNPLQKVGDRNIYQHLYHRQTAGSVLPRALISASKRALYRQMQPAKQLDSYGQHSCTGYADFQSGEAVVSYGPDLLMRFGYQCEPDFRMWNAGTTWHADSSVTSLQLGPRFRIHDGSERQTVYGTSFGRHKTSQLWRYSFPTRHTTDHSIQRSIRSARQTRTVLDLGIAQQPAVLDCRFTLKKVCLWTTHCSGDTLVVGGDHGAHLLTTGFDVLAEMPTKAAVMTAECMENSRRAQAWLGCRDGRLLLFDSRTPQPAKSITQSHLATVRVSSLNSAGLEHQLLSVDFERSIQVWDTRFVKRQRGGSVHRPLRRLYGHDTTTATASQRIALDISRTARVIALGDGQQHLHFWSLDSNALESTPFWTSKQLEHSRIQSIHLIDQPRPSGDDGWDDGISRQAPGLIALAENPHQPGTSFHWFTISP